MKLRVARKVVKRYVTDMAPYTRRTLHRATQILARRDPSLDWILASYTEGIGACSYILDAKGNPVREPRPLVYGQWMDDRRNVELAKTERGETEVSTVFLGLDHQWRKGRPPILFETMIFGGKYDGQQWRYATKAEALAGHAAVVAEVFGENNGQPREGEL